MNNKPVTDSRGYKHYVVFVDKKDWKELRREDIYEGISEGDFVEYPEYNLKGTLTVRVDDHLKKEVKWIVENEPAATQR